VNTIGGWPRCCWFLASVMKDGAMEVDRTMVRTMNSGRKWCRCELLQLVRLSRWCDDGGAEQICVEMKMMTWQHVIDSNCLVEIKPTWHVLVGQF